MNLKLGVKTILQRLQISQYEAESTIMKSNSSEYNWQKQDSIRWTYFSSDLSPKKLSNSHDVVKNPAPFSVTVFAFSSLSCSVVAGCNVITITWTGSSSTATGTYCLYYKSNDQCRKDAFEMILRAGTKHFPNIMGFLFRNYKGKTVFERLMLKFGATPPGFNESMSIIKACIPPSENHPILHHVANLVPKMLNVIEPYYPDALYLKDKQ